MYRASSDDGVNWTRDVGVTISVGSPNSEQSVKHPTAIRHGEDSITVFYIDKGADPKGTGKMYTKGNSLHHSNSIGGLTFSVEKWSGMVKVDSRFYGKEVNESNIVVDKNGNILFWRRIHPRF